MSRPLSPSQAAAEMEAALRVSVKNGTASPADKATLVVLDAIEALPHHTRLYPDLYADQVAQALDKAGLLR